ncbi:ATP synthase subunit alpha 1 [Frankliniella fusca]|uniref:ATP synthase subunit alpha 1 n=1 Tax=Frankliniella fusca TaxID=407009 RepID=A0AAE1HNU3_9NEOP|nr:ATP synthase subunit alpha 1 [Frankliniella fusca]KAK3924644.1 ATP synthase subunit alpha 1 [Frankliniella fusca]
MVFASVLRTLLHRERTYVKYAEGYGRLEPQKVLTWIVSYTHFTGGLKWYMTRVISDLPKTLINISRRVFRLTLSKPQLSSGRHHSATNPGHPLSFSARKSFLRQNLSSNCWANPFPNLPSWLTACTSGYYICDSLYCMACLVSY